MKSLLKYSTIEYPSILPFDGYNISENTTIFTKKDANPITVDQFLKFDQTTQYIFILGAALSIQYLHSKNIFFYSFDFDNSNILLKDNYPYVNVFTSTIFPDLNKQNIPQFPAPEVQESKKYSGKSDSYLFGVLIMLISSELSSKSEARKKLESIIEPCLQKNPDHRPTIGEICLHIVSEDFVKGFPNLDKGKVSDYLDTLKSDPYANFIHGDFLHQNGDDSDKTRAIELFQISAKSECSDAFNSLGLLCLKGEMGYASKSEAANYFKTSADKGNAVGALNYANLLYGGIGVPVDKVEAARYFKISSDKGNPIAMLSYGKLLLKGDGIPVNKPEAAKYFKMSAEKGNEESMLCLGQMLEKGDGIEANAEEAVNYYYKAAQKVDNRTQKRNMFACYHYGKALYRGTGIKPNKKKAAVYLKDASEQGIPEAMVLYANILRHGDGGEIDKESAIRFLQNAMKCGNMDAYTSYANMLMNGEGVQKNPSEAMYYFRHAAKNNNIDANYNLGNIYYDGICGINKDQGKAYQYFKKAADLGDEDAKRLIESNAVRPLPHENDNIEPQHEKGAQSNQILSRLILADSEQLIDVPNCDFSEKSYISFGLYGSLYKIDENNNKVEFCIELLHRDFQDYSKEACERIEKLIHGIQKLNHLSIVEYYQFCPEGYRRKKYREFRPVIVRQYNSQGTLFYNLRKQNQDSITLTKKLIIIYGVASAMSYLHNLGILHGDLTTSNIELDENFYPKINNIGFSGIVDDLNRMNKINPSYLYKGPEFKLTREYTKSNEVYSFGLILYEIFMNKSPFEGHSTREMIKVICYHDYCPTMDNRIPPFFQEMIKQCLKKDSYKRPTFDTIVDYINETNFTGIDSGEYNNYIKTIKYIIENPEKRSLTYRTMKGIKPLHYNEEEEEEEEEEEKKEKGEDSDEKPKKDEKTNKPVPIELPYTKLNINNYKKIKRIGSGFCAEVFKLMEKKTKDLYAAKQYNYMTKGDKMECNFDNEIRMLIKCKHPLIVDFIGYSPITLDGRFKASIFLEYYSKGSLADLLEHVRKKTENCEDLSKWGPTKVLSCMYGIAAGMSYMHSQGIIHLDLRPDNILLDDSLFPIITDLNASKEIPENESNKVPENESNKVPENESNKVPENESNKVPENERNIIPEYESSDGPPGTPRYMAPEIYDDYYSKACDVFSYSMLIYELIYNQIPFENASEPAFYTYYVMENKRPQLKDYVPECYNNLIKRCWEADHKARPSFDEIMDILERDHSFITEDVDEVAFLDYVNKLKQLRL